MWSLGVWESESQIRDIFKSSVENISSIIEKLLAPMRWCESALWNVNLLKKDIKIVEEITEKYVKVKYSVKFLRNLNGGFLEKFDGILMLIHEPRTASITRGRWRAV